MSGDGSFSEINQMSKRLRYQAYNETVKGFGTPTQSMFILDNDSEIEVFENDFLEFLKHTGKYREGESKPYRKFGLGFDGDMLDELFREVIKLPANMWNPDKAKDDALASKQEVFTHLYETITQDMPCIIHITEFPLLFLFEQASAIDVDESRETVTDNDELVTQHLKILREHGEYDLRTMYEYFYRVSTALLMELSNVFLTAPTEGMTRHIVVMTWRTQSLLLGFSPLTWSSGAFTMYDLSGRDIDGRYSYPVPPSNNPEEKCYTRLNFDE